MLKEIIIAIQAYFDAHQFIRTHKLWKWIVIPGLVYALLFSIGMYFFWHSTNDAVSWFSNVLGVENWLKRQRSGLLHFLFIMAELIIRILLMLFYFSLFKYLFLIIGSPLFAYLSERTESILEGRPFPFSFRQLLKDTGRGVQVAARNLLGQTFYIVLLLLLSFVPVVGWIVPLISLFVECYYYGFSMLDYSCERAQLPPAQSIRFISRHRGLALGNGLLFYAMHIVPVAGWVAAPAYAVVAATLSLHKIKNS
ncbi:MAG TPA: EI24 domain-containing protein [Chitinophagaceae bacterium]|nr:EI24 domain-containing protein [Chitinophagaceae bacterium]